MAEVATKAKPVLELSVPVPRLAGAVDTTARLSDEVLTSLEKSERAAVEAVGQFVITIEEALPREVTATSEIAKQITESGLETFDRLLHTGHTLLRGVVDSAAKTVSHRNGLKSAA